MPLFVLVLLSAVLYATVLLEALLGYPLSPTRSFLSEYAAADSPHRWIFAGADVLSSVLLLVALVFFARLPRWTMRSLWPMWVAWFSFFLSAVLTLADAAFPMPCAESLPTCPATTVDPHGVVSVLIALVQGLAACALLWIAVFRWAELPHNVHQAQRKWWHLPRTALIVIPAVYFLSSSVILGALIFGWPVGIIQRIMVLSGSGMFLCIPTVLGGLGASGASINKEGNHRSALD